VGVHIDARALHVLKFDMVSCIVRLSQWGGGGVISSLKLFLPPDRYVQGEGVGTLWAGLASERSYAGGGGGVGETLNVHYLWRGNPL
jgi:hypothetical protein